MGYFARTIRRLSIRKRTAAGSVFIQMTLNFDLVPHLKNQNSYLRSFTSALLKIQTSEAVIDKHAPRISCTWSTNATSHESHAATIAHMCAIFCTLWNQQQASAQSHKTRALSAVYMQSSIHEFLIVVVVVVCIVVIKKASRTHRHSFLISVM